MHLIEIEAECSGYHAKDAQFIYMESLNRSYFTLDCACIELFNEVRVSYKGSLWGKHSDSTSNECM